MKTTLTAIALAAAFTQPAAAVTFPSLTTIYVASGVFDDGSADDAGFATSVICSNVSGLTAQVRILILNPSGSVAAASTRTVLHGVTITISTHGTSFNEFVVVTNQVSQGVLNVELTQSGVFCTAMIVEAAPGRTYGIPLHMVRINPHPGAVE